MSELAAITSRGDFINGEFVRPTPPAGEIAIEDPGDLDWCQPAFPFSSDSVAAAVEAARRAWPAWRDTPLEQRAECLERFAEQLKEQCEPLARQIAREAGKPLWEARVEVTAMQAKIPVTLGAGLEAIREQRFELAPGRIARSRPHARGVLAVLGPFNFPGHLMHGHVVPALATGNTVVVKPSEHTPGVGQLYAELAFRAGFPPGVLNLIQGDARQGAVLAGHPDIHGILFTGSWSVGRRLLEATLDQPWKILALEMGGQNGVLVCEDADLRAAAHAIAFGACVTTGQRCSATRRVIVEARVAGNLIERLQRLFHGIRSGYPFDADVFMGPLISAEARALHTRVCELARSEGAEPLVEGGPCEGPRRGHYTRPSLHRARAVSRESRYLGEEHFVPDVCLIEVDSFEEGLAALDPPHYGLAASVFTRERERFERAFRETRTGLLNWNTSTVGASSRLPFGGMNRSGNDRPAGVLSTVYCSYPVASLEVEEPGIPPAVPGFPRSP